MSTKGAISREISRAVQTHIIRPLADKAVATAVRHGPTVVKSIVGVVGGIFFKQARHVVPRKPAAKQATFRIIEESPVRGERLKGKKPVRKARKT